MQNAVEWLAYAIHVCYEDLKTQNNNINISFFVTAITSLTLINPSGIMLLKQIVSLDVCHIYNLP